MWTTGWRMFLDYPIVGTGDIDLKELYLQYTIPIDPDEGGHLHNNFVQLLVTLGIVGFMAVVAIFVRMVLYELSVFRQVRERPIAESIALGAIAIFIGFQINGLFEWNFGDQEIVVLLWFSLGLVIAVEGWGRGAGERGSKGEVVKAGITS
jgi:O-antigen ligase